MKKIIIAIVVLILLGLGIYFISKGASQNSNVVSNQNTTSEDNTQQPTTVDKTKSVLGKSVEGRDITAYHFGTGSTELLFIGGIHGGYEWNTVLVAQQLIDYLKQTPSAIPANVKVTVIPVMNPDGLNKVVGTADANFTASDVSSNSNTVISGRFNGNNVDLSRNFDCDWKSQGTWQTRTVNGGTKAFSEPESQAIKSYVEAHTPAAIVTWYSAAGGVFASNCHNGVSSETNTLTQKYATASGYPAYQKFDFYALTGDMVNWFAKENIPAISVLLTNHSDTEWNKNKAGVDALLKYYAK